MRARTHTDKIVIHGAWTKPSMDVDAEWIYNIHVNENGWDDIGYHYIIKRDGTTEPGRPEGMAGAHCPATNGSSVGVCLIGGMSEDGEDENNYTEEQWSSLHNLVVKLQAKYNIHTDAISGHYEKDSRKTCPSFDMNKFRQAVDSYYTLFTDSRLQWVDFMGSVKDG